MRVHCYIPTKKKNQSGNSVAEMITVVSRYYDV